ncbi:porin family protein [Halpernia sp.]|uniref:porin family protein n=1 Tax=Halpernia sp. TaxID=2782209 RepID=UPI003A914298
MKKLFFITAFLTATLLFAQLDLRNTRFGITAGPNYSRVQRAHNSSGPRFVFYAGVLALIPIDSNDQFYLQPEVLYVGAGERGDRKYENLKGLQHATYATDYISIPLNFKAYFSEAESEFFIIGGPRFDFLISQKVTNPSKPSYEINAYGKAGWFNFNIGGGFGFSYKRQLEIAVKLDAGLSNAYPNLKNSPTEIATGDPDVQKIKSLQVFSLALSYIFK